jgi:hypothetical protein
MALRWKLNSSISQMKKDLRRYHYLLFLSNLSLKKGIYDLINAFGILKGKRIQVHGRHRR